MRAIGLMLIAAAAVHAILMFSAGQADRWWMILPALVASFGVIVSALSFGGSSRR
jgi:hypothetical protein